jgi:subtilisin family serine protease/subtilisin-like proprotein convertase family protein
MKASFALGRDSIFGSIVPCLSRTIAITGLIVSVIADAAEISPEVYRFREPGVAEYRLDAVATNAFAPVRPAWIDAERVNAPGQKVQFGSRIVLQLEEASQLDQITNGTSLKVARQIERNVFVMQASDALQAAREAHRLALQPRVRVSRPIIRQPMIPHGRYAALPNDPLFRLQWYLENRDASGNPGGADLNVRAAWPMSQGRDVLIAVADEGVDLAHPELNPRAAGAPHFNFVSGIANGQPPTVTSNHGTPVAGLALATQGNKRGMAGVAPLARLASWVVLGDIGLSDEDLMDMYQYRSNIVSIQNHSWGFGTINFAPRPVGLLERIGLDNAARKGRNGLGVVLVRSAGNGKGSLQNVNDHAESSLPSVIAVAAVRRDGRVTSYSNRGACVLLAGPSSDDQIGFTNIVATDRLGSLGYNQAVRSDDFADYGYEDGTGFSGTSASAPLVSGVAALVLGANPLLTYRDVQQILLLSARHYDLLDHDLSTNAAGLRVSHNQGFGVPDAAEAVRLAQLWQNRPALTNITVSSSERKSIPERPLLQFSGTPILPAARLTPAALHSLGPIPSRTLGPLDIEDIGLADQDLAINLTNKAAFILRGNIFFREKIERAARFGATFAIIYNNRDVDDLVLMAATDFTPIPAVFIGQTDGEAIRDARRLGPVKAQLCSDQDSPAAVYSLTMDQALLCEHVSVRIVSDHTRRGDLRIVLVSPAGTRSVLQEKNFDDNAGPADWTYFSTRHFFESSAGTWTVLVYDQQRAHLGSIATVQLTVSGTPLTDSDRDGLDDRWELGHFSALGATAAQDADGDGYSNAREQIMGTDPRNANGLLSIDLSLWNASAARISWRSSAAFDYEVWTSRDLAGPFELLQRLPGRFPETELFLNRSGLTRHFYRVTEVPRP